MFVVSYTEPVGQKSNEQRAKSNEQLRKTNEQRAKINEQRAESNEQPVKSNEQWAESNKQRATSKMLSLIRPKVMKVKNAWFGTIGFLIMDLNFKIMFIMVVMIWQYLSW